jgi:hypothetical protein
MSGVTERWKVDVCAPDSADGWVLRLRKRTAEGDKFFTYDRWHLTANTRSVGALVFAISPKLWFKPLGERMAIALEWAVDAVKLAEAAPPLAVKEAWLDAQASQLFTEALRDIDGKDA